MAESLRDQLLKSGIVKKIQSERKREPKRPASASSGKPGRAGGKLHAPSARHENQQEIDLAKAYALRTRVEARERQRAEREAAEQARLRRDRQLRIRLLLEVTVFYQSDPVPVLLF